MPQFFIGSNSINNDIIEISDKETYVHIARALRSKIGEKLLLIDENRMQYDGIIKEISSKSIIVKVEKAYPSTKKLDFNFYLAQSPLRSDSQTLVVEKVTELGISGIYPILTDNCAVKAEIIDKKIEKWQKKMSEASKQCERADIPICFARTSLQDVVLKKKFSKIIACVERNTQISLKEYLRDNQIQKDEDILVIIGPEGGFSQKEFEFFEAEKIPMVSLGEMILKAETAIIVALGNVIYEYSK